MDGVPPRGILALTALALTLPLAGALCAGRPLAEFTQFPPPLDVPDDYLRFSWLAAAGVAGLLAAVAASWLFGPRGGSRANDDAEPAATPRRFPWWGWVALAWTATWWTLAWTRWTWFAPWQAYTFFPLWLGFIVSVNAAVEWCAGSCLMLRAPRRWLALFGASAACWWSFEWLNRFVRNWHYLNAEEFGALGYFVHATVCFSTVLPAVAAVAEWLDSHRCWRACVGAGPSWAWLARRDVAVGMFVFGGVSLFATGFWPRWSYPALWISPLVLFLAASMWSGRPGLTAEMARGDWRRAAPWIVGALACGFFWEMWNVRSFAKWIYTVPGVDRWHLFEMPALGYAGYLPFGLECLLVTEWVLGHRWRAARLTAG